MLKARGVRTDYWKTGHSYIKRRTAELKALAGFEKSGHYFFNPPVGHGYDDGIVAAIAVLEMLDRAGGKKLSALMRPAQDLGLADHGAVLPGRQEICRRRCDGQGITRLKARGEKMLGQKIASLVTVNGVRVTLEDGTWGLVRASSNKPSLVVVVESPVSEANAGDVQGHRCAAFEAPRSRRLRPEDLTGSAVQACHLLASLAPGTRAGTSMRRIFPVILVSLMAAGASAQTNNQAGNRANYPGPQPVPMPPVIPAPQDIPYPGGTIQLSVDASQPAQGIMRVHEVIPVAKAGPLVLLYPRWLPGNHAPSGPISKFAGLVVHAGGTVVPWTRDTADVFAFHIDVPEGARQVTADFEYLSPVEDREGRVVSTDAIVNLEWNAVVLYPAGYFARRIPVQADVKLPQGWQIGTALEGENGHFKNHPGDPGGFAAAGGKYFTRVDLDPGARCRCIWTLSPTGPTSSK